MLLYPHPRIEVIVAGGTVRRADGAVVGQESNNLIQQFKVDYAVVGASAIDEEGALLDFDYREVAGGAGHHRQCAPRDPGGRQHQVPPERTGPDRPYQPGADLRDRPRATRPRRQDRAGL